MADEIRVKVDNSDLGDLLTDFAQVSDELMPDVRKITKQGAGRIKRGWAQRWEGHPEIKHLPRAINFDITEEPYAVEAEIGADHLKKQGVLAHLIEFGTLHSAPIPGGQPALDAEEPVYVEALERAAVKAVRAVSKKHGR